MSGSLPMAVTVSAGPGRSQVLHLGPLHRTWAIFQCFPRHQRAKAKVKSLGLSQCPFWVLTSHHKWQNSPSATILLHCENFSLGAIFVVQLFKLLLVTVKSSLFDLLIQLPPEACRQVWTVQGSVQSSLNQEGWR